MFLPYLLVPIITCLYHIQNIARLLKEKPWAIEEKGFNGKPL